MLRERDLPVGSVFLQKPFDDVTLLTRLRELFDADVRRGDAVHRRGA
jgi:hypothetical protein